MKERVFHALSAIWSLVYPLLIYEAVTEILIIGIQLVLGEIPDNRVLAVTALAALLSTMPLGAIYMLQIYPYVMRSRRGQYGDRLDPTIWWVIPAGIGACCFMNIVVGLLNITTPSYEETSRFLYQPSVSVQIICMAVIIPLTEELVFRGIGFFSVRRWLSFWPAALVTAFFFALFHGNLPQGIYAFVLGLLLAFCCERYRSLLASWLLHAAANLTSVVISGLPETVWQRTGPALFGLMLFGGFSLLVIAFYMMREDGSTT